MEIEFRDLGLLSYKDAWDLQEKLLQENVVLKTKARLDGIADPFQVATRQYLLFVEHPHVYTLGKSGAISNVLISEQEMQQYGISFFHTNRGGDITYHGPGQLVGYPILDLEKH